MDTAGTDPFCVLIGGEISSSSLKGMCENLKVPTTFRLFILFDLTVPLRRICSKEKYLCKLTISGSHFNVQE